MKMRTKKPRGKESTSSVPNLVAQTAIKNFLVSRDFKDMRNEFFIGNLNKNQVNQVMSDFKWLFKNYKDLEVLSIENDKGEVVTFIL